MVTKHDFILVGLYQCSVLAKIHMVTKPTMSAGKMLVRSVLAKIHMVTKPEPIQLIQQ